MSAIRRETPCKIFSALRKVSTQYLSFATYLEDLAANNREEAERAGRLTPLLSRIGCQLSEYWLLGDSMATPEPQPPTSPIPDDDESVVIDTGDVELDESDPAEATKSSGKRSLDVTEIEGSLHHWHWRQHPCFHLSLTITFSSRYYLFPVAQVVSSGVLVSKSHIGLERREIQLSNSASITSHLGISMTLMKVPRGVDQVIWNGKTVGPKSEPGPMRNIPKGMGKKEGRILREVSRGKTRQ
jgi:hypothetical protein